MKKEKKNEKSMLLVVSIVAGVVSAGIVFFDGHPAWKAIPFGIACFILCSWALLGATQKNYGKGLR